MSLKRSSYQVLPKPIPEMASSATKAAQRIPGRLLLFSVNDEDKSEILIKH